ncbi:MAG: hypothetical protein AB1416_09070 [Actinomycetota bacterium]
MSGHRPIRGADLHAQLRAFGPEGADVDAFEAWVGEDDEFTSLEEVDAACPPERIGLTPGGFAALFGHLFGEFE